MTTTLEITVVSTEGLHKYSSSLRSPFITLTKLPNREVYQYEGEEQMFRLPVDPTFFSDAYSCLHLELLNKRRIVGPTHQLGWCLIPPSDIFGLHYHPHSHSHSLRFLSYRLRASDGSKCPLIVNLSIRLICSSSFHTVTGIPLTLNMDFEGGTVSHHDNGACN